MRTIGVCLVAGLLAACGGETGPAGEPGRDGRDAVAEPAIPGEKGEPGENGIDGTDGIDGQDGQSIEGPPGPAGPPGPDGGVSIVDANGDPVVLHCGTGSCVAFDAQGIAWGVSMATGEAFPIPYGTAFFSFADCQVPFMFSLPTPFFARTGYHLGGASIRSLNDNAQEIGGPQPYASFKVAGGACQNTPGTVQPSDPDFTVVESQTTGVSAPGQLFEPPLRRMP